MAGDNGLSACLPEEEDSDGSTTKRVFLLTHAGRAVVPLLLVAVVSALAVSAAAAPQAEVIVLPGASSAEGIAAGRGTTFYAGDLLGGDIFRGDVQHGTAELFVDAPTGRMALGMAADVAQNLLFVAGGFTGQGYVYDTRTAATVASYQFASPPATVINDVALTTDGAWFTDSAQAKLYSCPSARLACRGRTTLALEVLRPTRAGSSTSTASKRRPTARPSLSLIRATDLSTRSIRPAVRARPSPG